MAAKEDLPISPIEKLDEDSLIVIFKKLPVADLVRAERVSKSWQQIAKQSWGGFKKLSLTEEYLGLRPVGTRHEYKDINKEMVEQIFTRCGRYLEEIDASKNIIDVTILIGKYCKNIQSINFGRVSAEGTAKMAKNCTNIRKLIIQRRPSYERKKFEDELGNLFSNNRKLRSVELDRYNYYPPIDCLLKLPLDQMMTLKTGLEGEELKVNFVTFIRK